MIGLKDKEELVKQCNELLEERLQILDTELESLQKASDDETKSSAGDKYETTREMITIEKNKLASQRATLANQLGSLKAMRLEKKNKVEVGTLLKANSQWYFISIALGPLKYHGINIFVVSPISPITQVMLGLSSGERFEFNKQSYQIEELF